MATAALHHCSLSSSFLESIQNEMNISNYVEHLFHYALTHQVCDIHIEPCVNAYRIRLRIDGVLHSLCSEQKEKGIKICTHLKVLAKLNIAEQRRPQDGRAQFNHATGSLELRINSLPTVHGEKIVMRLQSRQHQRLGLEHLGFNPKQLQQMQYALAKPQGLILITGPTGSGKTVSLYSALSYLNHSTKNLSTGEDPVEISLDGINQVHVNAQIDFSFASALRALLRQDPDILMIGEIRDLETADVALKAAQTGHLVLSSLHTSSAWAAISRLLQLGIHRTPLVQSLELIVAQRLLRKLCVHCKQPDSNAHQKLARLQLAYKDTYRFYRAQGCALCHSGYQGRIAIYDMMPMTSALQYNLIHAQSCDDAQTTHTSCEPLLKAAIEKVKQGLTSFEEIFRVLAPPFDDK